MNGRNHSLGPDRTSDKISARNTVVLIQAVWVLYQGPGFLISATPGTAEQRQYMSRALVGHIVGLWMTSNLIFVREES